MPEQKTYCSIINYIRSVDSKFYDALDRECAQTYFRVGKRGGKTFLYPTGDYKTQIMKLLNSYGDSAIKGIEMIQSLVIPLSLPNLSDFSNVRDDLPNLLKQHIEIKSVDAKAVKLACNCTITPDTAFKARGDRPNIHVYKIKMDGKTTIPLDGKQSTGKHIGKKPSEIRGGSAAAVAEMFKKDKIIRQEEVAKNIPANRFANRVVSYMIWASKNKSTYYADGGDFEHISGNPDVDYFTLLRVHTGMNSSYLAQWYSDNNGNYLNGSKDVYNDYLRLYAWQCKEYWKRRGNSVTELEQIAAKRAKILANAGRAVVIQSIRDAYAGNLEKAWADETMFLGVREYDLNVKNAGVVKGIEFSRFISHMEYEYRPVSSMGKLYLLGTESNSAFKRDSSVYVSTMLMFARSNYFMFKPIEPAMSDRKMFGSTEARVKDRDGINQNPYDLVKVAFNETSSRVAAKQILPPKLRENVMPDV